MDYYTEAMRIVDIEIMEELEKKEFGNFSVSFGKVKVNEQYVGYKIMKYDKVIGMEGLDLPPLTFNTMALWFTIPENIKEKIKNEKLDFDGGLHGVEHATIGIMPLHVMCDRWDVGGVSASDHSDTMKLTVFIYDGFEGLAQNPGLQSGRYRDFITQ